MSYPNTPCTELNIDICKTKKAAVARADFHKANNRSAVIYTTDGLVVANVEDSATAGGAQSASNVINTSGDRWVVASWAPPA